MLAAPHLADLGRARGSVPAATRNQDLDALGSSYIDSVLLRDRDVTDGWAGTADGTLEERIYYLQNWRADVVALVEPDGDGGAVMREWIKYSAYGVPFGIPAGDANSDGVCDGADDALISAWLGQDPSPPYDVRLDVDLNGAIDTLDEEAIGDSHQSLGRGVLSGLTVGNRKGYAGYEGDAKLSVKWHVRHRVLDSVLGRWLRRDPWGYVDGHSLLLYSIASPVLYVDPTGLHVTDENGNACAIPMPPWWRDGFGAPGSYRASDGVPTNRWWTARDCCAELANALAGRAAGAWACCNGIRIPCNLRMRDVAGEYSVDGMPPAQQAINRAIDSHEWRHAGDHGSCAGRENGTHACWADGRTDDHPDSLRREIELTQREIEDLLNDPDALNRSGVPLRSTTERLESLNAHIQKKIDQLGGR